MDVIKGSTEIGGWARTESEGIVTVRDPYLVRGVGGAATTRLGRVRSLFPKSGARLSGEPGVRLEDVNISAWQDQNDVFVCELIYKTPTANETESSEQSGSVSFTADTVTEKATEDIAGRKLQTTYFDLGGFSLRTISHEADVDRPLWTVQIRKTLGFLPVTFAQNFIARTNSRQWSGYPARTWLCRNITANETAGGEYDCEWLLSYNPRTWRLIVNTKIDGLIPLDVRQGNGSAKFDVYPLADFNAMGISFSGA